MTTTIKSNENKIIIKEKRAITQQLRKPAKYTPTKEDQVAKQKILREHEDFETMRK